MRSEMKKTHTKLILQNKVNIVTVCIGCIWKGECFHEETIQAVQSGICFFQSSLHGSMGGQI